MTTFIIYTLAVFVYLAVIGIPVSMLLASQCISDKRVGVYTMAPVFGLVIQMYLGTGIHAAWGLRPGLVVGIVAVFVLVIATLIIRRSILKRCEILTAWQGLIGAMFAGVIAILTNSVDLYHISFNDYFPIVNGDTFAYLGHIDQFRSMGWNVPIIEYPAGYKPAIEHAFGGREAVVAFTAGIAETLHLETHTAFFISQRLAFMLLATGVFGTLLFVTSNVVAAITGLFIATTGNFFLHQILQQFSSSSMGTVLVLALIFTTCWEFELKTIVFKSNWSPLCGFITGVLLLVSPETDVVTLAIVGLWFLIAHVKCDLSSILKSIRNFVLGFGFGALPTLPQSVLFAYNQANGAAGGHPGDWIANSAILFQASGLGFTTTVGLKSLPIQQAVGSSLTLFFYFLSLLLIIRTDNVQKKWRLSECSAPIIIFSVTSLLIATVLFGLGKGYALLKVIDYFSFLPALVFGLAFSVIMNDRQLPLRRLCLLLYAVFLICFGVQGYTEKLMIFKNYNSAVKGIPHISDLQYMRPQDHITTVIPDLVGDSLDIFLYVNRFNSFKFAYDGIESYRYRSMVKPNTGMPFVRVSAPGYRDKIFADITHAVPWHTDPYLAPYNDAMKIIGGNWLPPEGNSGDNMFRWLSQKGTFKIFITDSSKLQHVGMNIYPGPDLLPENNIEIQMNGLILKSLHPKDLPLRVDLLVNNLNQGVNTGSITVLGPVAGVRQVSVAKMSVLSH